MEKGLLNFCCWVRCFPKSNRLQEDLRGGRSMCSMNSSRLVLTAAPSPRACGSEYSALAARLVLGPVPYHYIEKPMSTRFAEARLSRTQKSCTVVWCQLGIGGFLKIKPRR